MSIRTVVVGYGWSGKYFHCYLVKLTPGLVLHGVVSGSAEKRAVIPQEQNCRAYATIGEALADPAVQLVVLATPNGTHAQLAVPALNAGKHVVTDKPMCFTLAECEAMIAAAQKNGVILSAFQNRRFDGDYLTVRKLLADGELGDVKWMELAWQGFRPFGGWRGRADIGGGRYYDLGAHLVDQVCRLFPAAIESVYCRMHHDRTDFDTATEALLVITFAGGKTGLCDFSSLAAISKPRFYVRGTKGTFCKYGLDPQEGAMNAGNIDSAKEDPATFGVFHDGKNQRPIPTLAGRWRDYYENIAAALAGQAESVVQYDELRREIGVLEAGVLSARSNQVIRVNLPALA